MGIVGYLVLHKKLFKIIENHSETIAQVTVIIKIDQNQMVLAVLLLSYFIVLSKISVWMWFGTTSLWYVIVTLYYVGYTHNIA